MSAHESERSPLTGPREVLPASQYLQEKLHERRSRNARPRRSRHTDFGPQKGRDDDIFLNEAAESGSARMFDSSPLAASTRLSDAGGSINKRRALGVRDMSHQMDRLTKQNFALKLELDHRREQTMKLKEEIASMREQAERTEQLEQEHKELMSLNTQLVEELEKRDKAVEEAMDIICDLEERVADLEEHSPNTRPSTAHADSGYAGTETQEQDPSSSSSPQANMPPKTPCVKIKPPSQPTSAASQKLQGMLAGQTPVRPRREPNVLSQKKPSTNALRSVYLGNARGLHPVKSFHSLLSRQTSKVDDDGEESLNSPRLSVLSESSFPSMYSPQKPFSPDRYPWEEGGDDSPSALQSGPRAHLRQDSIKRVSQWISERDTAENTPSKSNSRSPPMGRMSPSPAQQSAADAHYRSLSDALVSATVKSPDLLLHPGQSKQRSARSERHRPPPTQPRPTSFGGPIFGEPLLPPTPDSASTRMLRGSRSSIVDDRSLLDTTPAVVKGYDALIRTPGEAGVRTAPRVMRSSVEMRSAFASNLEYRNAALDALRDDDSSDEYDGHADAVRNFDIDNDGFPDGKSIMMGTPRRFLKHSKPPVNDAPFDRIRVASPLQRRQSSDQTAHNTAKPRLGRAETSPNTFGSLGQMVSGGQKPFVERVTSPRSAHSGSSGNRTVVQIDERDSQTALPEIPTAYSRLASGMASPSRSKTSASPVRTLTGLLRRLSNSQGSDRDKTTLPTLTSTPSSAYARDASAEIRRPRTSHASERPSTNAGDSGTPRPPSSAKQRRPSLQIRTKTEPPTALPPLSATESAAAEKERKSIFRRSNSHRVSVEVDPTSESQARSGLTKRRGSVRDAVTSARRPWR